MRDDQLPNAVKKSSVLQEESSQQEKTVLEKYQLSYINACFIRDVKK